MKRKRRCNSVGRFRSRRTISDKLVNEAVYLSSELSIEFCNECGDLYFNRAVLHAIFNSFDGEMKDIGDDFFYCRDCGTYIQRYSGFVQAYALQSDAEYLRKVESFYAGELSEEALSFILHLIKSVKIPSFCHYLAGVTKGDKVMIELENLNLIQILEHVGNNFIVLLNAAAFGLVDNVNILKLNPQHAAFYIPRSKRFLNKGTLIRKARKEALVDDFTDEQRTDMFESFGNKCALTGLDTSLHVDHVLPLAVGHGGTTLSNMLPIGQRLNSSKGAKNIFEWYKDSGDRFGVVPELFDIAIEYLAKLNDMTVQEYEDYIYDCHANPNDILTEVV